MDDMSGTGSYPTTTVGFPGGRYEIALTDPDTDYIQRRISSTGEPYEPDLLAAIASVVDRDDLVLDVGANIGNHTLWLAHAAGARVWAFEPNNDLVGALEQSVQLGSLQGRVTVFHAALSSSSRSGKLVVVDGKNLGSYRIDVAQPGDIKVLTLDDIDVPRVRAMKVDVEGMELEVLRGASSVIERDRPHLFVETADVASFRQVAGFLEPFGYTCLATYNATPTHHVAPGMDDPKELRGRIHELVIESRVHELNFAESRRQFHEASDKYRELTQHVSDRTEKMRAKIARQKHKIQEQRQLIQRTEPAKTTKGRGILHRLRARWRS
jgi:FkbM family methyltransferase